MKTKVRKKFLIFAAVIVTAAAILFVLASRAKEKGPLTYEMRNEMDEGDNYSEKIEYPQFSMKKAAGTVADIIREEKKDFAANVSQAGGDETLYLNISSEIYTYKDFYSLHMVAYEYLGDGGYRRADYTLYYDIASGSVVELSDIFADQNAAITYLSQKCGDELRKQGLNDIIAAYDIQNIVFSDEWVKITFSPENISDGKEHTIYIGYADMNAYLKPAMQNDVITPIDEENGEEEPDDDEEPSWVAGGSWRRRDLSQFIDKKLIILTFDDGPNGDTSKRLVEGLIERNARATFFLVGSRVGRFSDTVRFEYDNGNTIGIHGYSHNDFCKMSLTDVLNEINETNALVAQIDDNTVPVFIRPPYGSVNDEVEAAADMVFVLWSVDTRDWESRDAQKVCDAIVENAQDGAVVLMHDLYDTSVDGALAAIDILQQQGYAFVSVEEYLQIRQLNPETHKAYHRFETLTEDGIDASSDGPDNTAE